MVLGGMGAGGKWLGGHHLSTKGSGIGHRLRGCSVLIVASDGLAMAVRAMLLILGAFHVLNGAYMLLAPMNWYMAVPGVSATGPLNHHFISDIALAFLASGTGLMLGARARPWAGTAAMAGATWPALHALLHIAGWLEHGFPTAPPVIVSELIGVVGIGILGIALAWSRLRQEGVF